MKRDYLTDHEFAPVVEFMRKACEASRKHSALAQHALAKYGSAGCDISGCVRTHFPEEIKDQLRALARSVSEFSDSAWKLRPAYTQRKIVNRIGRLVATRDGSGYYGPQPQGVEK